MAQESTTDLSMASSTSNGQKNVIVAGAGLAGSMATLVLARRGHKVHLLEARPEFREILRVESGAKPTIPTGTHGALTDAAKRSINLALSVRGLAALQTVGLAEKALENSVPMRGRMIHKLDGSTELQPYGVYGECIYSISRGMLNSWLLEASDELELVDRSFGVKILAVDENGTVTANTPDGQKKFESDFVVGADGAFSKVRDALGRLTRLNFNRRYIRHGYKELCIPPTSDGEFALEPNALHIWPRHEFMMIALPNCDKSFTVTLFAPFEESVGCFNSLTTRELVAEHFNTYFADAMPLMPTLLDDFFTNPSSPLLTTSVNPWHWKDKILLIGDAAHAAVPFYGQGMNCAFEDCLALDQLLDEFDDMAHVMSEFSRRRIPAGNGLQELSLNNYLTMGSKTVSPVYLVKRAVNRALHRVLGDRWIPEYTMVSFTSIPYDKIIARRDCQDQILSWMTSAAGLCLVGATLWRLRP